MNIKPVPLVNFQGRSHCKVVRETKGGRASPLAKVFFCFKNICKIFLLLLFHYVLLSSSSQTKPKQNTSVPYLYIFSQKDQTKYIFYLLNHYPHMNEHLGSWISTLYILSRRCDECLYGNSTFNLLLFSLFERTHTDTHKQHYNKYLLSVYIKSQSNKWRRYRQNRFCESTSTRKTMAFSFFSAMRNTSVILAWENN